MQSHKLIFATVLVVVFSGLLAQAKGPNFTFVQPEKANWHAPPGYEGSKLVWAPPPGFRVPEKTWDPPKGWELPEEWFPPEKF